PAQATENTAENVIVYGRSSSGIVGTYRYSLSIDKSGHSVLTGGRGWAAYARRGETQLTAEERGALLRAFEEAKFADFQRCYGKHTPVNQQNAYLFYRGDRTQNSVTWLNAGSHPKPPDGWFRIVGILDQVWARAEQ